MPPVPLLVSQKQRLAALRTVCFPPCVNPATARLQPTFPSLSSSRAPDGLRAHTKGLSLVYLPLSLKAPRPSPPLRNPLPMDTVAHRTIALTGGQSRMLMINAHLVPEVSHRLPPQFRMESTYFALKKRVREALIGDLSRLFPPLATITTLQPYTLALYGPRHVHRRANPPNECQEKLPGGTARLEGLRGR